MLGLLARGELSGRVAETTGYAAKWVRGVAAHYSAGGPVRRRWPDAEPLRPRRADRCDAPGRPGPRRGWLAHRRDAGRVGQDRCGPVAASVVGTAAGRAPVAAGGRGGGQQDLCRPGRPQACAGGARPRAAGGSTACQRAHPLPPVAAGAPPPRGTGTAKRPLMTRIPCHPSGRAALVLCAGLSVRGPSPRDRRLLAVLEGLDDQGQPGDEQDRADDAGRDLGDAGAGGRG